MIHHTALLVMGLKLFRQIEKEARAGMLYLIQVESRCDLSVMKNWYIILSDESRCFFG